jgi:hypothetical protein
MTENADSFSELANGLFDSDFMQAETAIRESCRDYFQDVLVNALIRSMEQSRLRHWRRDRFIALMKNRRGPNVRIAVEKRKAEKRAEERHHSLVSCSWMRNEMKRKRNLDLDISDAIPD